MTLFPLLGATSALLASQAEALKVGLLTDLHLHLRYDPWWGPYNDVEGDCMVNGGTLSEVKAPMGRYGCDSPAILISTLLKAMNEFHPDLDLILLTGDFNAHHTAMNFGQDIGAEDDTYGLLMAQHSGVIEMLTSAFPNTPILPVFGNNDSEFHDNPQPVQTQKTFYDFIYNEWFKLLPGNVRHLPSDQVAAAYNTFKLGGYYRIDVNEWLSVLALNTLYFDSVRSPDLDTEGIGKKQLAWFEEQLATGGDRKFMPIFHVYAGGRYNSFALWNRKPNEAYFKILSKYRSKILLEVGGHDHFASLRSATDEQGPFHNLFVGPSITAWYYNNPSVSSFVIDEED